MVVKNIDSLGFTMYVVKQNYNLDKDYGQVKVIWNKGIYFFSRIYHSLVMYVKDYSTANAVSTNMQELKIRC